MKAKRNSKKPVAVLLRSVVAAAATAGIVTAAVYGWDRGPQDAGEVATAPGPAPSPGPALTGNGAAGDLPAGSAGAPQAEQSAPDVDQGAAAPSPAASGDSSPTRSPQVSQTPTAEEPGGVGLGFDGLAPAAERPEGPGGPGSVPGLPDGVPVVVSEGGGPDAGAPGSDSGYGGLLLLPDPGPFVAVAGEVLDLCDPYTALYLHMQRPLAPGEEPTQDEIIGAAIIASEAECDEPGGARYVYMTQWAQIMQPQPTPQQAVEWRKQRLRENTQWFRENSRTGMRRSHGGHLLGFNDNSNSNNRVFPWEEQDSIVVLFDTVSLQDDTVRGMVHNLSRTQYARHVVVAATPPPGSDNRQGGPETTKLVWRWPLTVQPGERAPFEIQGWTQTRPPSTEELAVTASMSPTPDIKRSFAVSVFEARTPLRMVVDNGWFPRLWPESTWTPEQIEEWAQREPWSEVHHYVASAGLIAPDSHPELADQVMSQRIQDARMFISFSDNDGKVTEVVEYAFTPQQSEQVPRMFVPFFSYGIERVWVGGANPPPDNQPDHSPEE